MPKLREESPSKKARDKSNSADDSANNEATSKDGLERLQKIIAGAGICSRRKAEELILLGQVTVNGEVVNTLGAKANPKEDIISVDGQVLYLENVEKEYYLLNKPRGYITTTSDPQGRPTVMDLMTGVTTRVYPVGRLDYASEGLLLLTNDGDIANKIMHPSSEVRRTYAVKIKGNIAEEQLKQLKAGIQLSDGFVKPVRVQRGERLQGKEWVEIELTEGKNLEIRRLFAVLDIEVDRLRRTKIGHLDIAHVPVGKYVTLSAEDVRELFDKA